MPEVSAKGHPFTVFPSVDGRSVRVLFRPAGPFTRALSDRLGDLVRGEGGLRRRNRCPRVLVEGLRRTSRDMVGDCLGHRRVLVVCGGVGITPYLSLIRALREVDRDYGGAVDGKEPSADEDGFVYEDDVEDGGGSSSVIEGPGATRVDVHWMCREAGLADHVVRNYLAEDGGAGEGATNGRPRVTIGVTVHLTSPDPEGDDSFDCEEDGGPHTWRPPDRPSSTAGRASPRSSYELGRPSVSSNIVPALTSGSIMFGGLYVISFCASNVTEKHVAETRLVAVLGVLAVSAFVSFGSMAATKIAGLLLGRKRRYDPVGSDGDGNVELARSGGRSDAVDPPSIDGGDVPGRNQDPGGGDGPPRRAVTVSRSRGRPDVGSIVRDAIAADGPPSTVGIFVCGPRALDDAVGRAARDSGCAPCSSPGRVVVYRESFEM